VRSMSRSIARSLVDLHKHRERAEHGRPTFELTLFLTHGRRTSRSRVSGLVGSQPTRLIAVLYRQFVKVDITAIARIRACEWGEYEY
jgi:hypothetical protein